MEYDVQEYRVEVENRIRNLAWTVSGDYSLEIKPDAEAFARNKYVALYDAVKQGAFAKYFDADGLAMYIIKKQYLGAQKETLMRITRLCVEEAVRPLIVLERPGVADVREKAYEAVREREFHRLNQSFFGRVQISMIRDGLGGRQQDEQRIQKVKERIYALGKTADTMEIIRTVDFLYNTGFDPSFEKKHGGLEKVLAVEMGELVQEGWRDFLDEEMYESVMEQFLDQVSRQVTSLEDLQKDPEEEEKKRRSGKKSIVVLDEKAMAKMRSYMELNFGKSYLEEAVQERLNRRLCTGAHTDCSLYYTDGILVNPVLFNAQYVNAKKQAERNRLLYHNSKSLVRHNVDVMTANLKRALVKRTETEEVSAQFGAIVPARLWQVGRVKDGKLFRRILRRDHTDFAVDILMDASGSQRDRQSQVALQAFIISRALSNAAIPHRVMGFCTFWDYTVMQRYREYDAPAAEDEKVFEFTTSSNNRDGLAIRAAADSLLQREEENRILIVLSDGRPNDVVVNRPGSRNPRIYCGEYAVQDTAQEVRKARGQGILVLGVFAGEEKDLAAEKKIFGKDFAYIRDIRNFSAVVSQYLQRLLEW